MSERSRGLGSKTEKPLATADGEGPAYAFLAGQREQDSREGQAFQLQRNRLPVLAAQVRSDLELVRANALQMAEQMLAIGRALVEAKVCLPHGGWEGWLAKHVALSPRSARRYMQLVKSGVETATVADLGIRAALEGPARSVELSPGEEFVAWTRDHWSEKQIETFIAFLERFGEHGWLSSKLAVYERQWKEASAKARSDFAAASNPDNGGTDA